MTIAPPVFACETNAAGSPQKNETTGTPSRKHTSSRSSCAKSRFRFIANGLLVRALVSRINRLTLSMSARQTGSAPRPPALLTAAANLGPAATPIGAETMGISMPSMSHSAVLIVLTHGRAGKRRAQPSAHVRLQRKSDNIRNAKRFHPVSARTAGLYKRTNRCSGFRTETRGCMRWVSMREHF